MAGNRFLLTHKRKSPGQKFKDALGQCEQDVQS